MSVSDRDLLELAAKAAGYDVRWNDNWKCFVHNGSHNIDSPPTPAGERHVWVPLHDDGDALRLAVKLRMEIERSEFSHRTVYAGVVGCVKWREETDGENDIYMVTRRAIVRAAAEIGKAMQEQAE